jgi:hypothetical protein
VFARFYLALPIRSHLLRSADLIRLVALPADITRICASAILKSGECHSLEVTAIPDAQRPARMLPLVLFD